MILKSSREFQGAILEQLSFSPFPQKNCTLFKNNSKPELGHFIQYRRPNYYDFGIADYTIPSNFSLSFNNPEPMMRFGTVYTGVTKFRLANQPVSSFTPSSFFVAEKNLKGQQVWKEGQHYHGAEVTIYESYFKDILYPQFSECITFEHFLFNETYHYLPLGIVAIIQQLNSLALTDSLTPILLESKILECISILTNEVFSSPDNSFSHQLYYGDIQIGKKRKISLTSSDVYAIQKAHDILTKEACNPPTIENLSRLVFLNQQKLKAGFSYYYHMSIGEYTNSIRMATAANLLSTTDISVDEISKHVGYHYCGNFAKMFKKTYNKTPLNFRKTKNSQHI